MIDELAECFQSVLRKAKKTHKCYECHGIIDIGEKYHYQSGIWAGEPASYKICVDCEELKKEIEKTIKSQYDKIAFGELYEYVFESKEVNLMHRFMITKRKRGAEIKEWMQKRFDKYNTGNAH